MPAALVIAIGTKFGRWTVLKRLDQRLGTFIAWACRCDCGTEASIPGVKLVSGKSKSCGCYSADVTRMRSTTHGHAGRGRRTATYKTWRRINNRCFKVSDGDYSEYGGRGIKVCEEWKDSFARFLADMGEKPDGMSIDRIDNNGDYSPSNCRWATPTQQIRNRRNTAKISYRGESKPIYEWAEILGLPGEVIADRLRNGWTAAEALSSSVSRQWSDDGTHWFSPAKPGATDGAAIVDS